MWPEAWGFCKLWSILVSPCFAKTEEKTIKSQFGVNCRLHYDHYRQHCGLLHLRVSVCVFLCAMTAYSWPPFNRKLYIHTWSHVSLCKHPFHSSPTATMKKKKKKRGEVDDEEEKKRRCCRERPRSPAGCGKLERLSWVWMRLCSVAPEWTVQFLAV